MKLVTIFEYDDLVKLQTQVIVEMWDNVVSTGSGKRKLRAEFTEEELRKIQGFYKLVYRWHYQKFEGTGIPQKHQMTIEDYNLLQRACNFFGTYS